MSAAISAFDAILAALRIGLFAAAVVFGLICVVDWLARTRRLNPFGRVARFCRETVDPMLLPIERQIVRAGGLPASAPWWALAGVVFGGIVLLSALGFVRTQLGGAIFAAQDGPRGILRLLIQWTFEILRLALIVRVLLSWVHVSPYSRWVRWAYTLSEPILRPLRQIVPTIGMIDITPIVAYLILGLLESFLRSMT